MLGTFGSFVAPGISDHKPDTSDVTLTVLHNHLLSIFGEFGQIVSAFRPTFEVLRSAERQRLTAVWDGQRSSTSEEDLNFDVIGSDHCHPFRVEPSDRRRGQLFG